jgi:HD-GYP domain-containing protein (c-di-GMP phosphodiesterase class II)
LRLAVAQNDRIAEKVIQGTLLNREFAIDSSSLIGYVAGTAQLMNIPNTFMLPAGAPFRINREADNVTSYRARSILAIPLSFQTSKVIGAIELINRIGPDGHVEPFPDSQCSGLQSLAAMAAVTIYNAMLREELKRAQLETIMRLSVAAEFRDNETAAHLRRLSHTSAVIAQAMGLPPRQVDLIRFASPMHDVGKIGISDSILCKPGRLTEEERKAVQAHPAIGTEILGDPMNDMVDAARAVAMTHHEKWDGTGYPDHLKGEEIPLIGRITGLADVFDALVSKRCYKDAMPVGQALDIVRGEEGKHFDPAVVKAFFSALDQILEFYKDPANQEPIASVA